MYVPAHTAETDAAVLHALIRCHPLGAWVTAREHGLDAEHVPFLVDSGPGEFGTLTAHVARANPVWRALAPGVESLVIFQGPDAYVTPAWYPAKQEHGRVVPTWNYVVVHARGEARAIHDPAWLRAHLARLSDVSEAGEARPWSITDAPAEYVERQLKGIVGIEMTITRLTGKFKVSRNRTVQERANVAAGLRARGGPGARELAGLVSPDG